MIPDRNIWTNGSYDIAWLNDDEIVIRDKRYEGEGAGHPVCIMDGGDFEGILSSLITAYQNGLKKVSNPNPTE